MAAELDLEYLKAHAEAQAAEQQMVAAACMAALQRPVRVLVINACAVGVEDDEGQRALVVGQPNGELIRIPLVDQAIRDLHRSTAPAGVAPLETP